MKKYDKTKFDLSTSSSYFQERQLPISRMKHHLGQNFIRNNKIAIELAELSKVNEDSLVLEIGTGAGELTEALLQKGVSLISCEIDADLFEYLDSKFREYICNKQLLLLFQDASKLDFAYIYKHYFSIKRPSNTLEFSDLSLDKICDKSLVEEACISDQNKKNKAVTSDINEFVSNLDGKVNNFRVCANLPYYLTRDFLYKMFIELSNADSFALMLQKEAAERLLVPLPQQANYKRDLYGPLAIFREFYGEAKVMRKMSRSDFIPSPRVDSYFVVIEKKDNRYNINIKDIYKLIFAAFKFRRKTLLYNLNNISLNGKIFSKDYLAEVFEDLSFKKSIRAEELLPFDFIKLYEKLK